VVDDTAVNLKVASKLLSKYGADVDACSSGEESIEKCKYTSYDIVFMDHMMPGMDGVEAMNTRDCNNCNMKRECRINKYYQHFCLMLL